MTRIARLFAMAALALAWTCPAEARPVTVFAAASLKTALDAVAAAFTDATGTETRLSYAGSSALARQIEQGAPAQVFVSANPGWMDVLDGQGLLAPGTRTNLLTNRLVLIAGQGMDVTLDPVPGADLAAALGDGRLAMALVDAVPAGIYGKAALQSLGLWDSVAARVAQTDNVRAALALVATGEAPLGIVYATDAVAEPAVSVLGRFPAETHPPIVFPVALLTEATDPADAAFLDALHGAAARAVFERNGFRVLDDRP